MPARLRADAVGRAGIVGRRDERVVAPLAVRLPDRVDRRQVDDVEAQLGQPRELLLHAFEPTPGAREELVPGAEAAPHPVDLERQRRVELAQPVALGVALDGGEQLRAHRRVVLGRLEDLRVGEDPVRVLDQPPVGALGARGGRLEQDRALADLARELRLARLELAPQLVAPGAEDVRPGADRELPAPDLVDAEGARPADAVVVRVDRAELGFAPFAAGRPGGDDGADLLVAVAEHVGRHLHDIAHRPLGGVAPGVDAGLRVLDMDPRRRGCRGCRRHSGEVSAKAAGKRRLLPCRGVGFRLRMPASAIGAAAKLAAVMLGFRLRMPAVGHRRGR